MAVDVSVRDLIGNYAHLRDASTASSGQSAHLLLFYAVECGLKAAVLGKNGRNARSTESLPEDLRNHDLRKLAKELKIGPSAAAELAACRRKHDASMRVAAHELHQAWRYGALLNQDDEQTALTALSGLSEWCKKEHGR